MQFLARHFTGIFAERDQRLLRLLRQVLSEHLIAVAFAFCACGVMGLGCFALYRLDRTTTSDAWVSHTLIAIGKLERLHLTLVEAESAGRGFLVSASFRSRSTYMAALAAIDDQLRDFRDFTADNPRQQKLAATLEQPVARRFAYLDGLIELRVKAGPDSVTRSSIAAGAREMEAVSVQIGEMKATEVGLLNERQQTQKGSDAYLATALAVLIAFGVAIMSGVFWYMKALWIVRAHAERAARHEAYHDALTGLPNRRLLQDRMIVALARARRYKEDQPRA